MRTAIAALLIAVLGLSACTPDQPSAQQHESARQQSSYNRLVAQEPAKEMDFSPTRQTINFWISTWSKPHKLSFVYLIAANGQKLGYYVFDGLPVSYCASLTPTYLFVGTPNDGSDTLDQQVPAPSVDGVYYSGGQCNSYYGRDATTGAYLEFSIGSGINYLLYDQPLHLNDVQPLGFTTVKDVAGKF